MFLTSRFSFLSALSAYGKGFYTQKAYNYHKGYDFHVLLLPVALLDVHWSVSAELSVHLSQGLHTLERVGEGHKSVTHGALVHLVLHHSGLGERGIALAELVGKNLSRDFTTKIADKQAEVGLIPIGQRKQWRLHYANGRELQEKDMLDRPMSFRLPCGHVPSSSWCFPTCKKR